MQHQFQEMVDYMGPDSNFSNLILSLQKEAMSSGAVVKSTKPDNKIEDVDFYAITKVTLVMEGTYAQLVLFLSNVSKLNRLVTVEKLELEQHSSSSASAEPGTDLISFTGTFVGYKYVSKPDLGKDPKNPGTVPTAVGGVNAK
jgi:Tfp pilus assembly protein PilO